MASPLHATASSLGLIFNLDQTVVRVRSTMRARQPLEPGVLGQPQRHAILGPELFQLCHDAVCNARDGLRQQTVHHGFHNVQLILSNKSKKMCERRNRRGRNSVGIDNISRGSHFLVIRRRLPHIDAGYKTAGRDENNF